MSHYRRHRLKPNEIPINPDEVTHVDIPAYAPLGWAALKYDWERRGQKKYREDEQGNRFRMRRGRWVLIPKQWVGKTTDKQTIRKRASKKGRGASYRRFK